MIPFVAFSHAPGVAGVLAQRADEPGGHADDGADAARCSPGSSSSRTCLLASLSFVEQKVEVVAYVQNNGDRRTRSTTLVARIEAMPEVASVEFVTRDEALARFREDPGGAGPGGPHQVPRVQPAVRSRSTSSSRARPTSTR